MFLQVCVDALQQLKAQQAELRQTLMAVSAAAAKARRLTAQTADRPGGSAGQHDSREKQSRREGGNSGSRNGSSSSSSSSISSGNNNSNGNSSSTSSSSGRAASGRSSNGSSSGQLGDDRHSGRYSRSAPDLSRSEGHAHVHASSVPQDPWLVSPMQRAPLRSAEQLPQLPKPSSEMSTLPRDAGSNEPGSSSSEDVVAAAESEHSGQAEAVQAPGDAGDLKAELLARQPDAQGQQQSAGEAHSPMLPDAEEPPQGTASAASGDTYQGAESGSRSSNGSRSEQKDTSLPRHGGLVGSVAVMLAVDVVVRCCLAS